jgi:hypothetical protein
MSTHSDKGFEHIVPAEVRNGPFTSSDQAITEVVHLFQLLDQVEKTRVLGFISYGSKDMPAGPERHKRNKKPAATHWNATCR